MMDRVTSLMRLNQSVFYVLGDKFKYSIYLWKNGEDKIYPCRNKIELKGRDRERKDSFQQGIKVYLVSSNIQWWDNAKWSAVGFIYDRMNLEPPILALMFRNVEFGKKIVQEWHDNVEAGKAGVEIQIVKGVLKQHPTWYRVCIAPEMPHSDIVEGRYMGIMCRKITMTPNNSKNIEYELDNHKAVYNMDELKDIKLLYPELDAKNLFLRDDKKRNYYLVTVKGDKKVDLKEFRNKNNTRPLSFASDNDLLNILGLTPGSVTPFGLLNDKDSRVIFYIDEFFKDKKIGVHPNDNRATVWIKSNDLVNIIKESGNSCFYIEM